MRQKLKKLPLLYIALMLSMALGVGLGSKTAHANPMTVTFVCEDGSTDVNITKNTTSHQTIATCASGSMLDYINYESKGIQPVSVAVTCPGSETVSPNVDAPNQPSSKYVFTCVNVSGGTDNPTATPTNDTPDAQTTAATNVTCSDGKPANNNDIQTCPPVNGKVTDKAIASGNCSNINKCDLINKYINPFINFLAALVGVAVVASIIIGGIQYGSSAGDPSQVTAAKNRIRNAILALVTFLFLYTLLNFLMPGGLF